MNKLYCKNCKWFSAKQKLVFGGWEMWGRYYINKNNFGDCYPRLNNSDGTCSYYKNKWYLFWVKGVDR